MIKNSEGVYRAGYTARKFLYQVCRHE